MGNALGKLETHPYISPHIRRKRRRMCGEIHRCTARQPQIDNTAHQCVPAILCALCVFCERLRITPACSWNTPSHVHSQNNSIIHLNDIDSSVKMCYHAYTP